MRIVREESKVFYTDGSEIREIVDYKNFVNVRTRLFYQNGRLHNSNGPAVIVYHSNNGSVRAEYFYQNGVSTCVNGPSMIEYDRIGNIVNWAYASGV